MVEEVVVAQFYGSVHLKTHTQRLLVYQLVYHALHELRIPRKIHDHGTSHKFVRLCRGLGWIPINAHPISWRHLITTGPGEESRSH